MNNIKVAIILIVVFTLAIIGFYYLYQIQIQKSQDSSLLPFESPAENFPTATASASPQSDSNQNQTAIKQPGQVAGAVSIPQSQPETGTNQVQTIKTGIEIQSPIASTVIGSPVTINGLANVPNNLVVEVRDGNGQILGIRKVNACFSTEPCQFSVSIVFSNPQTPNGTITAYSQSLTGSFSEYTQSVDIFFK